jgi:hypothetical protein
MNRQYLKLSLVLLLLFLPALACGGGEEAAPTSAPVQETELVETEEPAPTPEPVETEEPEPAADIQVSKATFAHGLSDEMRPLDPGSDFTPDETVYLSLKIKGRPKGIVAAHFYWRDKFIAEATADLTDINSGVIFSIGEDTYVGYSLTHEKPLPVGEGYRAEVFYNDQPVDSYPFRVVPPPEAIPSQVKEVTLAKGADENYNPVEPTTAFVPSDAVYLVGRGDFGLATWLQADWYVSGQLDEAGTRSLTLDKNMTDVGFSFHYRPEGGWPAGEHSVVLTVDGAEVDSYSFTVAQ